MNKNIIITGGLGFIGSNLIERLIKKKYFVVNVDKANYASNFYNKKKFRNLPNYKFYKLDINNKKKIKTIFDKYKQYAIFNLAAETHVDRSIDKPDQFIKSNILGVYNLLEIFREFQKKNKKSRFIHISTDEVFGDVLRGRSKETDAYKPSSPYAASKASSDHLVYSYIRTYKLNGIVTNCSNNYGPNQHPEKLIPKLIYNIIHNLPLPLYARGKNSREWIFVKDHCEALLKVYESGKAGEFYNIGSNLNFRNIDIAQQLLNIARKKIKLGNKVKIIFVKDRPGHDFRYALNSKKIRLKLKWRPEIKFDEGLENTVEWYLKNEFFLNKISRKKYDNRLGLNV